MSYEYEYLFDRTSMVRPDPEMGETWNRPIPDSPNQSWSHNHHNDSSGNVFAVVVTGSNDTVHSGSGDNDIIGANVAGGVQKYRTTNPTASVLELYAIGSRLYSGNANGDIEQYTIYGETDVTRTVHSDAVRGLAVEDTDTHDIVYSAAAGTVVTTDWSDNSELWSHTHNVGEVMDLTVSADIVYSVDRDISDSDAGGNVVAASTDSGSLQWSVDTGAQGLLSVEQTANYVFAGTSSGDLIALDKADGSTVFTYSTDEFSVGAVTYDNNRIYFAHDHRITAFDVNTFKKLWTHSHHGSNVNDIAVSQNGIFSCDSNNTVIRTGRNYAQSSDGTYTMNVSDGSEWIQA